MASFTLLQIVQNILSDLNSDEVNSIGDTNESLQVANIVQQKFYDILSRADVPEHTVIYQLNGSNNINEPTLMTVPTGFRDFTWLKYFNTNPNDGSSLQSTQFGAYSHNLNTDIVRNTWIFTSTTSNTIALGPATWTAPSGLNVAIGQAAVASSGPNQMYGTVTAYSGTTFTMNVTAIIGSGTYTAWTVQSNVGFTVAPGYLYVTILGLEEFLDQINRFNVTDGNVGSYTFSEGGFNFTLYYKNNHQPSYCTVLANQFVLFDSFDNSQDSTLQGSKTLVYGLQVPTFSLTDAFIPQLTDLQFQLLINEAKQAAWYALKQILNPKVEQEIKRQWVAFQKNKNVPPQNYFDQLPDMGRVPRTGGYSSGGYAAYKWMRQAGP